MSDIIYHFFPNVSNACSEPMPTCAVPRGCKCAYRVRSCDRSVSVVAGARISILYTDRISPASANYTRQFSERSSWPVGRSVGSLELTLRVPAYVSLSPRYPSHHSSFRGSYLRVTLRWPLTCALCVCLNRTTVYSCRETASTSLTVTAILDPLESMDHQPSYRGCLIHVTLLHRIHRILWFLIFIE